MILWFITPHIISLIIINKKLINIINNKLNNIINNKLNKNK